jgi:aspartate 1-decarboxylase
MRFIEVLKSKIHRARVTDSNLHYIGSVTIDEDLMDAADLIENERVHIYNITNGERFETYVIKGERGSGTIGINGAAAHKASAGDLVIIVSYMGIELQEAREHKPVIIFPDHNNKLR